MNPYQPVPKSRAIRVAAAAKRLDVSSKTIYRAVARGEIPAIRVGRSIRIAEGVLEQLLRPAPTDPTKETTT